MVMVKVKINLDEADKQARQSIHELVEGKVKGRLMCLLKDIEIAKHNLTTCEKKYHEYKESILCGSKTWQDILTEGL